MATLCIRPPPHREKGQNESKSLICFAQNNSEIRFWPEKKSQYSNFALQILYRKKKLATKIAILAFFFWSEFLFREIWLRIFRHFLKSCLFPTKKVTKKGLFFSKCQKIRSQISWKKNSDQRKKASIVFFEKREFIRYKICNMKTLYCHFSLWSEMNFRNVLSKVFLTIWKRGPFFHFPKSVKKYAVKFHEKRILTREKKPV